MYRFLVFVLVNYLALVTALRYDIESGRDAADTASLAGENRTATDSHRVAGIVDQSVAIFGAVQKVMESPVVRYGNAMYQIHGAVVADPKRAARKSLRQQGLLQHRDLLTSDLVDTLALTQSEVSQASEELEQVLDFKSSEAAFKHAAAMERHFLESQLGYSAPPTEEACRLRFDVAAASLERRFCDGDGNDTSSEKPCMSDLVDESHKSALGQKLNKLKKQICPKWRTSWLHEASDGDGLDPLWIRHVLTAVSEARALLLKDFPSPAAHGLGSQAEVVKYATDLHELCVGSSSIVYNPLGYLGSMIRRADGKASARDVNMAKTKQLRRYIHEVACPEVKKAICKGGCWVSEPCGDLTPEAEAEGEFASGSYKAEYCDQMLSFYVSINKVCRDPDAHFMKLKDKAMKLVNLVTDARTLYGLAGFATVVATMWQDPGSALNTHNALALIGAVRSLSRLGGRFYEGWQDESKKCEQLAMGAVGIELESSPLAGS